MLYPKPFSSPALRTLLTIAAAAAVATPALASSNQVRVTTNSDGTRTARISFADLDLTSTEGQRQLKKRVNLGLSRICPASGELPYEVRSCRNRASKVTQPQVFAAIQRSRTRLALAQPSAQ